MAAQRWSHPATTASALGARRGVYYFDKGRSASDVSVPSL